MARPVVEGLTERLYERLPELYRVADEERAGGADGYPLLRYLSLIVDQAGKAEAIIDRMDYVSTAEGGSPGDTSDLVDPATADAGWLPWLAQLVGVDVVGLSVPAARDAIAFASAGWRAGTRAGMADAARSALTGSRFVRITSHAGAGVTWGEFEQSYPSWADIEAVGSWAGLGAGDAGDPWMVEVLTRPSETPSAPAVLAAIKAKNAKPAGVILVYRMYQASWSTIEAKLGTWAGIEAAGSWAAVEDTV